jgi:hypothetical protein
MAITVAAAAAVGIAAAVAPASAASTNEWRVSYRTSAVGGLYSVAALSRTNAWAAGVLYKGQTLINKPYVLHWNGKAWKAVSIPASNGYYSNDIAASSASNVWVLGVDAGNSLHEKMFRWDGAHWHSISVPEVNLGDPVVLSASHVWASGQISCTGTRCVTDVWHWNGSAWQDHPIATTVYDMAGTAASGLWAVGVNGQKQLGGAGNVAAYRWNGTHWAPVSMPHPRVSSSPGIAVDSASDVWIGAFTAGGGRGYAMHWNGRTWQALTAPASIAAGTDVVPDGHSGVWLGPWAHWTGRSWSSALTLARPIVGAGIHQLVKVPGTSASYWGAAGIITSETSTTFHPAMLVYGPLP